MSNFFNEFEGVNSEAWLSRLEADLKGKPAKGILDHHDEIEGISFKAHVHKDNNRWSQDTPGNAPFGRTGKYKDNAWIINNVVNEIKAEEANKKALNFLMKGASGIILYLNDFTVQDCNVAIQKIGLEYIHSTFYYTTDEQYNWLKKLKQEKKLLSSSFIAVEGNHRAPLDGVRTVLIDASQVQKCGGNCVQEIAFALKNGHDQLFNLMESGLPIDDAVTQLKFRFGISSNYFFEMAKYRSFRILWNEIITAYNPQHECSAVPFIEAETISLNKSLKDPYTNLLRITTESLSAILAGVDELTLHAFDAKSNSPYIDKHQRLVNNIALILQEESYMNIVIDPSGGSYSIEELTNSLSNTAWSIFQQFDMSTFKKDINKIAQMRIKKTKEKENIKVGINAYMNPDVNDYLWNKPEKFLLGSELILERDCKIDKV
jgi:methylmalonyl-CoA mutase